MASCDENHITGIRSLEELNSAVAGRLRGKTDRQGRRVPCYREFHPKRELVGGRSTGRVFVSGSGCRLAGNRSRPKTFALSAPTMRAHTAKKREPAMDKNESLIMIRPSRIISDTPSEFPLLANAARSGASQSHSSKKAYCSGAAGGAWRFMRDCMRASRLASICLSCDCWSAVSS